MLELDAQIRQYVRVTSEPLSVDDVLSDSSDVASVPVMMPRGTGPLAVGKRWLVAAAATIVVLVVVGVPLLLRSGDTAPADPPPPPTTVSPTPPQASRLDAPVVASADVEITWRTLDGTADTLPGVSPHGIGVDPRGGYYVDVGGARGSDPTIWTSPDALAWTRGKLNVEINWLRIDPGEANWALSGNDSNGWMLLDRTSGEWVVRPLPEPVIYGGELEVEEPVPVQSGELVLVPERLTGTAWLWTEGGGFVPVDPPVSLDTLVSIPRGGFAVYPEATAGGPAMVWSSMNGASWTNHGTPGFWVQETVAQKVVRMSGSIVVDVETETGRCEVWTSVDGISWTPEFGYEILPDERILDEEGRFVEVIEYGCAQHTSFGLSYWNDYISTDQGATWKQVEGPPVDELGGGAGVGGLAGDLFYKLEGFGDARQLSLGEVQIPG